MSYINKTSIVFVLTLLLTPIWLMLAYIKWQYIDVDLSLALAGFQKWPWLKASLVMATFTYLYAFYAHYQLVKRCVKIKESASIYAGGLMWMFFFIFHPGSDVFGDGIDVSLLWMLGIPATHYFSVKYFAIELSSDEVGQP